METAVFYRAKAVELHDIADRTELDAQKADWHAMARTWDWLATRTEAADRVILDNFDRAWPSQAAIAGGANPSIPAKRS